MDDDSIPVILFRQYSSNSRYIYHCVIVYDYDIGKYMYEIYDPLDTAEPLIENNEGVSFSKTYQDIYNSYDSQNSNDPNFDGAWIGFVTFAKGYCATESIVNV